MVDATRCITGPFGQIEGALRRKVGAYARHHEFIKIGATSHPARRERSHRRNGWSKLILLWRTTSYRKAQEAEKMLTRWTWDKAEAEIDGGGGLSPDQDEYFIYLIVA